MAKSIFLFLFTFLFVSLYSISFSQQTYSKLKLLTDNSDLIVTAKVFGQKSNWNADKSRIFTEATLQVDEYLKGNNNGSPVVVTYPGGEVDGIGELYTHMPKFGNNEDVLVFLKKDAKSKSYKVFNGEEGKIKIIKDEKTGEKITESNIRINSLKAQIKSYINK
jgi:hypothetical protein